MLAEVSRCRYAGAWEPFIPSAASWIPAYPRTAYSAASEKAAAGLSSSITWTAASRDRSSSSLDTIGTGMTRGALEGMIGTPADMDPYIDKASKGIYTLMDTLKMSLQDPNNEVGKSLRDIQMTLLSLRQTTAVLNQVMAASAGSLNGTMKNVESITSNLKTNNEKITTMLSNINDVTGKANTIDFSKINKATEGVGQSIDELKKTLAETQSSLNQLTSTFKSVNAGEGTLGQLAKNDSVYHSLNRTLIQTQALMQDVRLNPKRYINLNPFRKYKQYVVPSKDPLLDTMQMRYNSLQKKN